MRLFNNCDEEIQRGFQLYRNRRISVKKLGVEMKDLIKRFAKDEKGLESVEWAVMAGLIVVAAIAAITGIGSKVAGAFQELQSNLAGLPDGQ